MRTFTRINWMLEHRVKIFVRRINHRLVKCITCGRADIEVKAKHARGLNPGVTHIVGIADPSHGFACNVTARFNIRVNIRQNLAWMIFVGQTVDHRYARIGSKTLDDVLTECADHDDVDHARNHLRSVFDRLTATELRIFGVEINRVTA